MAKRMSLQLAPLKWSKFCLVTILVTKRSSRWLFQD